MYRKSVFSRKQSKSFLNNKRKKSRMSSIKSNSRNGELKGSQVSEVKSPRLPFLALNNSRKTSVYMKLSTLDNKNSNGSLGFNTPKSDYRQLEAKKFDKRLSDFNMLPSSSRKIKHSVERKSILKDIYSPRYSHFHRKRIQLLDKVGDYFNY